MSKALFRFLRGELNGFYINNINNALNEYTADIKRFFIDFQNQQFEAGSITDNNLYGLGKFASVFLPRRRLSESRSAMFMTDGHEVSGNEFSERGLFNTNAELFEFVHTDPSITSPDINTLATDAKRSSLVGDEEVEGYIAEDEIDVLDDEGKAHPDKIMSEPPVDKAYSDFYGNQFLFLSEGDSVYEKLPATLFIELFKALQWIRYNGKSIASLVKIIQLICPQGAVTISGIEAGIDGRVVYVHYVFDVTSPLVNKEARLALLEYIVNLKFKQVLLVEEE